MFPTPSPQQKLLYYELSVKKITARKKTLLVLFPRILTPSDKHLIQLTSPWTPQTYLHIVFNNCILLLLPFIEHAVIQIDMGIKIVRNDHSYIHRSLSLLRHKKEIAILYSWVIERQDRCSQKTFNTRHQFFKNPCNMTPTYKWMWSRQPTACTTAQWTE